MVHHLYKEKTASFLPASKNNFFLSMEMVSLDSYSLLWMSKHGEK